VTPSEAAALATIRQAFGIPVLYSGGALVEKPISAIKSDVPADAFPGVGNTARRITFEIGQDVVPDEPDKECRIMEGETIWRAIDITRRDDVGAWEVVVTREYRPPA
jgi:hypothetical protein